MTLTNFVCTTDNSPSKSPRGSSTKKVNYAQDGSGRDSYIANDNGGFFAAKSTAEQRRSFNQTLRDSKKFELETTYDYMQTRNGRMKDFMSKQEQ